ncbi:biopolymer transporter ExbD [Exilibacterium tricleocarpae]|uniref:Biopolymer transporter ExbD n=1 Tax=Exilibacterium tricleocarpae TaxID=2591008 RepID=A0A545TZU2_9GAMM|nr:biopolymer transporter ExbD [Exilibacterium tricleocarpae]TQV82731.1 biopolymer transporter ExbD [Exilibacterium tricleocarpae]
MRRRRLANKEAELDITSFMNLMIVLVPVLLMSMVFSHITVLDLKLPDMAASDDKKDEQQEKQLELVIRDDYIDVNYPAGIRLKRIEKVAPDEEAATAKLRYDFKLLSDVLQEVKRQLREKGIEKRDILILSEADTDYQTIVSTMDTVRSFKAVVAASEVDAELFPDISLGDAPEGEALVSVGSAGK